MRLNDQAHHIGTKRMERINRGSAPPRSYSTSIVFFFVNVFKKRIEARSGMGDAMVGIVRGKTSDRTRAVRKSESVRERNK